MTKADLYLIGNINEVLKNGFKDKNPRPKYSDGTPAHTLSINQVVRTYNLENNEFPICTLRPIAWKSAIKEILWIYQKQTSSLDVLENDFNVNWWREWESKDVPGTIGQRYGATVRRYELINKLIDDINNDPYGRRKIVSLWQENDFNETDGLLPCAFLTMWNVRNVNNKEYLDMTLIQRSGDMLMASGAGGVNEVQYAALLMMISRHCGLEAGKFVHFVQNEQIYDRHLDGAMELKKRFTDYCEDEIRKTTFLTLNNDANDFYKFTINDFVMNDYLPLKPQIHLDIGI